MNCYLAQHEVSTQKSRNAELRLVNRDLSAGLEDAELRNADLSSTIDGLTVSITSAEARIVEITNDLQEATSTNADLTVSIASVEARIAELTDDLQRAITTNASLTESIALADDRIVELTNDLQLATATNTKLVLNNETLETELENAAARYALLVDESGNVDQLRAEAKTLEEDVAALRAEIAELTDQRAPLIVESSIVGFSCTGSMEPKITCLDTATWLDNFAPEDIVVGTIIRFEPTEECALESDSVAHRVMDIKHEDGTYFFWPRGDANGEPDGCWIPEEKVNGYIIEVQKNAKPENAGLRTSVNGATSRLDAADATQQAAWTAYDSKYIAYCGERTGQTCYLSNSRIRELERLYEAYSRAFDAYKRAFDFWECWQTNARAASLADSLGVPRALYSCLFPPIIPPTIPPIDGVCSGC